MRRYDPNFASTPTVSLHASEKEIRDLLVAGKPVVFPPGQGAGREIDAAWIIDLADDDAKVAMPIFIAHATITGALVMAAARFVSWVFLVHCRFEETIDLRTTTFEGALVLRHSTFAADCLLNQILAESLVNLVGCRFERELFINDGRIQQSLHASGASFSTLECIRLRVEKAAFFQPMLLDEQIVPAEFNGTANFIDARFGVTAEFDGAVFRDDANFSRVDFGSQAFFRTAKMAINPNPRGIGRPLLPSEQLNVSFAKNATFRDARFRGAADFSSAQFQAQANFVRVKVDSELILTGARFAQQTFLGGLQVGADAFLQEVTSDGPIEMQRSSIAGALHLGGASIPAIDMRRCRVGVIALVDRPTMPACEASMDLRGASFERIDGNWRGFLSRVTPFSRDPYDAVEKFLRSSGEEREASDVYYQRRKREGFELRRRFFGHVRRAPVGESWRDFSRIMVDAFERWVCGYGVRAGRLFFATFWLFVIGAIVFDRPGALLSKSPPSAKAGETQSAPARPKREEAILYSVALAIPIVQLPPLERWRPSSVPIGTIGDRKLMSYETFSSLYRLAGLLFVPLTVAVLTGLLYRRERA